MNLPSLMNWFKGCAVALSFLGISSEVLADEGDWIVEFSEPTNADDVRMKALMQQPGGVLDMVDLFESLFRLKRPINLQIGAAEGPHYDSESEVITIPYHFAFDIEQRFLAQEESDSVEAGEFDDVVLDVVMHTLFHELGHALMWQYELPLFFEEEDVVDSLANLLLLEYTEYGTEVAISAAEMFRLEAPDIENYEAADFWAEHSLDLQRHYDVYCSIYGAYPEDNAYLIEDIFEGDEHQAEVCIDTYQRVAAAWEPLLKPILIGP